MRGFVGSVLTFGLLAGLLPWAHAEVSPKEDPLFSQDLPSIQQMMKVVGKVNLRQVDRNTQRTFDEFFNRKSQMNESVQMLEKATAVRQSRTSGKTPPRSLPKAY